VGPVPTYVNFGFRKISGTEPLRESVAVYISDINRGSKTEYFTA